MKQRIITAFLLMAIALPCLIYGGIAFKILIGMVLLLSTYELLRIAQKDKFYILIELFCYIFVGYAFFSNLSGLFLPAELLILLMISLFFFSICFPKFKINQAFFLYSMLSMLLIGIKTATFLRIEQGLPALLFVVIATYGSDTGAYFVGVKFGKHKLIPRLSPNKTVEGSIGGIVFGTIIASLFALFFDVSFNLYQVILISFILTITAQIGDLTFSNIKRYYQLKDFSNLLPGHGGILDRVDSLVFNLVAYSLCYALFF